MSGPNDFGPWATGLDPAERKARFRCLAAIIRLVGGPAAASATRAMRDAEADPALGPAALAELDRLPALTRRRALATFAEMHRPTSTARHP